MGQRHQRTAPSPSARAQQFRQTRVPEVRVHPSPDEVAAEGLEIGSSSADVGGRRHSRGEGHPKCSEEGDSCSSGHPSRVQLEQCQQFVTRYERRVAALDAERLEEGKANLERPSTHCGGQQVASPPDSASEVEQLRL